MSTKRKKTIGKMSDPTASGTVELTEEQLAGVEGGANRLADSADDSQQTDNVTINFAKVKYVYTPQGG